MYSLSGYGSMIADRVRMDAYAAALRRAITPGAVVLDLGTGLGAFAIQACRLGASRVYAVESDDAISIAREVATASGFGEKIAFLQGRSQEVALPERMDVVVSDLRGVLPLFGHHIPALVDARRRHLRRGGTLIPRRDRLWAALVEAPDLYSRHLTPWDAGLEGVDFSPVRRLLANTWRRQELQETQLLVVPRCWATLEYTRVESANVRGEACWTVARPGTAHGLALWFDAELTDDVAMSNAPGAPATIYGHAFFPLAAPVDVAEGDAVSARIEACLTGDDYVWRWRTRVAAGPDIDRVKAAFDQSTLFGAPLAADRVRRGSADHVPVLSEDGRIDLLILQGMATGAPLAAIAREAATRFPACFSDDKQALDRVTVLSRRYSRG